jgi:hypothetical protein
MLGGTARLCRDQRGVQRNRDAARDLVLQGEQIAHVAVEALRPEMRVGLGIDQLGGDADPVPYRRTLPSST